MSEPFLGQITVFPYSFAPRGWADCAGQLLPISQNTALFSLLGTNFGGNGTSNFALPDLQGRIPIGQGTAIGGSSYVMGETGGEETVSLQASTTAAHTHSLNVTTVHGSINIPTGQLLATAQTGGLQGSNKGNIYNPAAPDTGLVAGSITTAGGSQPHNNIQPSVVLRYCIALEGVFPPRS
jgi:microcystin-dependent protein